MHGKLPPNPFNSPLKILLLLSSLHGGGAERVAVHLLNRLDPKRFDVRMGLLRKAGPYLDQIDEMDRLLIAPDGETRFNYEGSNREQHTARKIGQAALNAPRVFRAMISQTRPDVVMSFLKGTNLLVWLALMGVGIGPKRQRPRWIAREGNNVLAVLGEEAPNEFVRRVSFALTRRAYRCADVVLANSTDMASGLARDLALDPARMRMINNPIDLNRITAMRNEAIPRSPNCPFILSAGRLEVQKGHEVLIRAFAQSEAWRSHELVILGKGSRLAELHLLAAHLGVGEHIRFIGFVANPYAWMAKADLFVLPSRWEGFPSVAAEALACGVPLLLTDCRFGPRDVIEPGVSGALVAVDDPLALAAQITALLADPQRRQRMRQAGQERVRRFAIEPMIARYADLFGEVAAAPEMIGKLSLNASMASSPALERGWRGAGHLPG